MTKFRKIFKFIKQNNIKNVEVCFVDGLGKSRIMTITKSKLKDAFMNGLNCDGSSVFLNKSIEKSDVRIFLDENSCFVLPSGNLLIFANTDVDFDARKKLLEIEHIFKNKNLKINFGTELEFFMFSKQCEKNFKRNEYIKGNIKNQKIKKRVFLDNLSYFEHDDSVCFEMLNELIDFCDGKNIRIEALHHECGHGQFELDFKFDSPSKTADRIIYLKRLLIYFARQKNLEVSFLPKPFKDECGSGMHTNISIFYNKKNLFFSKKDANSLSHFAYKFARGIVKHAKSISVFANPTKNSYQRLNYGQEVPLKATLSCSDRTALIRIPKSSKNGTRLEFRLPDISCNPYITFFAILVSGFENKDFNDVALQIKKKNFESKNINQKDERNFVSEQIRLPKNLKEAKIALNGDKLLGDIKYVF